MHRAVSLIVLIFLAGIGCRPAAHPSTNAPVFVASSWSEADRLFRNDPQWAGADDAYSIDLGEGRTLWLFGDTFIDTTSRRAREGASFIRNSIGIQTGYDPSNATMDFYWRTNSDGAPASFFPERDGEWFWPGHGVRIGDQLLLFLMRIRSTGTGLMFEGYDWEAVLVGNLDADPLAWDVKWLETPGNDLGVIVGSASVVVVGEHLYAFGSQEPVVPHPIFVVRWPVDEVVRGDLANMEWWTGAETGWMHQSEAELRPQPVYQNGQTEQTIHYDEASRRFLQVQTMGFGPAVITLRAADQLTGIWSEPDTIYTPPEFSRPNVMIYAGKAHPQLAGADLVLTYATNTLDFTELFSDSLIYYPRFIRLTRGVTK